MAEVKSKVLFILGGGPRIGNSVARKFLMQGYRVAISRRNAEKAAEPDGSLPAYIDVTKPQSIEAAFKEVESKLGVPNVVIYNAAALTLPPEPTDPFAVLPASFTQDLSINVDGAYAALYHATRAAQRQQLSPPIFIATGNVTPFKPNPIAVTLGAGKAALAYLISIGAIAYDAAHFRHRFYFASQVTADGDAVPYPQVSGEAHGEVYWKLVNGESEQHGWDVRFQVDYDGSPRWTRRIQDVAGKADRDCLLGVGVERGTFSEG